MKQNEITTRNSTISDRRRGAGVRVKNMGRSKKGYDNIDPFISFIQNFTRISCYFQGSPHILTLKQKRSKPSNVSYAKSRVRKSLCKSLTLRGTSVRLNVLNKNRATPY